MSIVVTSTITTHAEKISFEMTPALRPVPATINPTSPREIIPTPTRSDCTLDNPHSLASDPHPSTFPAIATATIAAANMAWPPRSRALARRPMLMKKTGTSTE